MPDDYRALLTERERGAFNRVRPACSSREKTFFGQEFRLYVGIKVVVFYDPERKELFVTALIDNSSIPNYYFEARVLIPKKGPQIDFVSFGDSMKTPKTIFHVEAPDALDWRKLDIAYFEPDDSRIVRTEAMVDTISPGSPIEGP